MPQYLNILLKQEGYKIIRNQETRAIQYLNVASDLLSTQSLIRELTKDKVHSKFMVITSSIERANKLCKLLDHPNVLIIHSESSKNPAQL